jgi:hypothetical protein
MLEDFEKFTKQGRTFKPKISIRKRGQLGFNSGAINKFGLDKYNYAIMYISKERDKIAIKFTNDQDAEGAVKIMKRPGNFAFSGKAFFDCYDIEVETTRAYDAEWLPDDNAAMIRIKKLDEAES